MAVQAARRTCLAAALVAALGGCGAIDAYRSARGLDEADPNPATAPFSKNLAAGEAADYPNLSTVPPPPTTASTAAERASLTQKLIAERTTAETDLSPLPPAPAPGINSKPPAKPAYAAGPATSAVASGAVAPLPASKAPMTVASAAAPEATAQPGLSSGQHGRQSREAPPQESSLQMPVIPTVPDPEATRPPPPPPNLAPAPAIGPNTLPAATAAVEMPAPPPPAPTLAVPPPPVPTPVPEIRRLQQPASIAAFDLADPPRLAADQRARLDQVAEAYRSKPGTVKIVAYAAPAPAGQEQLASFRAALARAQFVAAALGEAGVPSNKIQTEASPGGTAGRVEVRLAP